MAEQRLYLLPFRVVVGALLGVLAAGILAGAVAGWLVARRVVRVTPTGERVVERVEQITVSAEDAVANAAAGVAESVVAVQDGRGRTVAMAVALTKDGVLVGTGAVPSLPVRVRRASGELVDASVVRVYPEFGLYVLRAAGEYQTPAIERDAAARPGAALAAVARTSDGFRVRVRDVRIESDGLAGGDVARALPALASVPVLLPPVPASFRGAPVVGVSGRLLGVVLPQGPSSLVVSAAVVDRLLRDALEHQEETIVTVHGGLQGRWTIGPGPEGAQLRYRVARVSGPPVAEGEAVRAGDDIVAVRGQALQGPAPLGLALLEAARKHEPLPLTVRRGTETVSAVLVPVLR